LKGLNFTFSTELSKNNINPSWEGLNQQVSLVEGEQLLVAFNTENNETLAQGEATFLQSKLE